jgi:hypothetical protein
MAVSAEWHSRVQSPPGRALLFTGAKPQQRTWGSSPLETGAIVQFIALFFLFPVLFFLFFHSCYSPVQRSHLSLRYFNDFCCIRRTSAPCKSPVFLF